MLHKASGRKGEHQMPLAKVNTLDKQKQNQIERQHHMELEDTCYILQRVRRGHSYHHHWIILAIP